MAKPTNPSEGSQEALRYVQDPDLKSFDPHHNTSLVLSFGEMVVSSLNATRVPIFRAQCRV